MIAASELPGRVSGKLRHNRPGGSGGQLRQDLRAGAAYIRKEGTTCSGFVGLTSLILLPVTLQAHVIKHGIFQNFPSNISFPYSAHKNLPLGQQNGSVGKGPRRTRLMTRVPFLEPTQRWKERNYFTEFSLFSGHA